MKRMIPFIFVNDAADPNVHRSEVETDLLKIITVGVKNYTQACEEARKLVGEGAVAIELCSAFGPLGVAKVVEAIENKVPVGVIRFDKHPGVAPESGDAKFL